MMMFANDAACNGMDLELFYEGLSPDKRRTDNPNPLALAACKRCPVTEDCLKYAIDNGDEWGIWGGKTPYQRENIRRRGLQWSR